MGSDVHFLDESVPVLDDEEMEDLYRHFLLDDMPEEDDGDEDFEPPPVDEEEEGEEAGVRRRNVQARELNDLVRDAYQQLGPSVISPGLRERVLDQLSMHFQLLVQTGILAAKESSAHGDQEIASLGMLEHLACGSGKTDQQALRTRSRVKTSSMCWDPDGEGVSPVGIPGLLPPRSLRDNITEAGRLQNPNGNLQTAVERLMVSRGAVVWPQLLPRNTFGGIWHCCGQERERDIRSNSGPFLQASAAGAEIMSPSRSIGAPPGFSMVEDRLLCRGIHLHGVDWDAIKANFLPHRPTEALMHRYAVLSGWASMHGTTRAEPVSQVCSLPWTQEEDLELRCAVQKHGKKWARIARDVLPKRGRASLRSRWGVLEERVSVGTSGGLFMHHRLVHADRDGKERVDVQAPSLRDKSMDRRHTVSFQKSSKGGLRSSGGPLFRALRPEVGGPNEFGGTRHATMEGLPKGASILPPSPGKLTPSKRLLSGAGKTQRIIKSPPATGHHEQPDGASRKRRLLTSSNPDQRWDGDESLGAPYGEDGCVEVRPRYPVSVGATTTSSRVTAGANSHRSCSQTETSTLSEPSPDQCDTWDRNASCSASTRRIAYAEDELSDDSDKPSEVQGASRHVQSNERYEQLCARNSSGSTQFEHRYEEDELSDDFDP